LGKFAPNRGDITEDFRKPLVGGEENCLHGTDWET